MTTIILPGEPVSQQRPRVFAKGAMDPCWKAKEQHRAYIREKYSPQLEKRPLRVYMHFYYAYPKSMSMKKRPIAQKTTRPDVDNLAKYIMDMANGVLWEDDAQIIDLNCRKIYGDVSQTEITIFVA